MLLSPGRNQQQQMQWLNCQQQRPVITAIRTFLPGNPDLLYTALGTTPINPYCAQQCKAYMKGAQKPFQDAV